MASIKMPFVIHNINGYSVVLDIALFILQNLVASPLFGIENLKSCV